MDGRFTLDIHLRHFLGHHKFGLGIGNHRLTRYLFGEGKMKYDDESGLFQKDQVFLDKVFVVFIILVWFS